MATTLGQRIQFALDRRQQKPRHLAKAINKSPQMIDYLLKEAKKTGEIVPISEALRVRPEWLNSNDSALDDSAFLENQRNEGGTLSGAEPITHDALIAGRIPQNRSEELMPVYAAARAGERGEVFLFDDPVDYIPTPPGLAGARDAYGMIVLGESMRPMFRPNQTIHVNPHRRPAPGKGVVIWMNNNAVLVKEYVRRTATHLILKEYQPEEREFPIAVADVSKFHAIVGMEEGP